MTTQLRVLPTHSTQLCQVTLTSTTTHGEVVGGSYLLTRRYLLS